MKSAILAQKINQIQKKIEAAEEKKTEEKQRSTYKPLESTLRMLNPFSVFKVMLTGLIKECDHTIYPAMSCINYIKTITEVQHDKKNKLVRISMEDESSVTSLRWEEIIDRLESKGDYYTSEWARVLESYFESLDDIKKFSKKLGQSPEVYDFGMSKKEYENLKSMIQKNYMCMHMKGTLSETNPIVIEFNQNMIQYLGYNLDEFCSDVLAYGIPEIYPNSLRKYADKLKELFANLSEEKFDGTPSQNDVELLRANFSTTFVRETIFIFRSLNDKNEFVYELLMQYEHLSTPPPNRKKTFVTEFTSLGKFGYQAPDYDKERVEFLAKFYNVKKEKSRDESKVCRIRYLDPAE